MKTTAITFNFRKFCQIIYNVTLFVWHYLFYGFYCRIFAFKLKNTYEAT